MYKTISALILASLLLLVPMSASAAKTKVETFTVYGIEFTLTNKKCTDKKIIKLARELGMPKEVENKFLAGTVKDAKDGLQKMCYMVSPADDNLLFVVDVLGNSGVVPKKEMGM